MKCKCSSPKDVKWDTEGASFVCTICSQTHRMCCVINKNLICSRVDEHEGLHCSISSVQEWARRLVAMTADS